MRQAGDPAILEWAAQEGRVLLTHDVADMTKYAYERIRTGKPMPGGVRNLPDRPRGDSNRRHSADRGMQRRGRVGSSDTISAAAVNSISDRPRSSYSHARQRNSHGRRKSVGFSRPRGYDRNV
jgi:hypothetical protein